jgi:hypothetical protein
MGRWILLTGAVLGVASLWMVAVLVENASHHGWDRG